jgi:hypothetical protein
MRGVRAMSIDALKKEEEYLREAIKTEPEGTKRCKLLVRLVSVLVEVLARKLK